MGDVTRRIGDWSDRQTWRTGSPKHVDHFRTGACASTRGISNPSRRKEPPQTGSFRPTIDPPFLSVSCVCSRPVSSLQVSSGDHHPGKWRRRSSTVRVNVCCCLRPVRYSRGRQMLFPKAVVCIYDTVVKKLYLLIFHGMHLRQSRSSRNAGSFGYSCRPAGGHHGQRAS